MKVKKGDYGFDIIIEIYKEDGSGPADLSALDLSNTKLKIWRDGETTLKVNSPVSFYTDGTDGKLKYTVQQSDFTDVGIYHAEIVLVWTGIRRTVELEDIFVEDTAPA